MKRRNRRLFNRAMSWLLVVTMMLPLCLTNGMVVNAENSGGTEEAVYLCELSVAENDGDYVIHKNIDNKKTLKDVQGTEYSHGFGMHSPRSLTFELNGEYDIFTATFSPHEEVLSNRSNTKATEEWGVVEFKVYLDDQLAYETGSLSMWNVNTAVVSCNIDVSGAQTLKIEEGMAGIATCDSAIVGNPALYKVTEVAVTAGSATVNAGEDIQFTANVTGDPEDKVTWTIVSATTSASTSISDEGILTVGADETVTTLTVKAASPYNGEVFKTSTVTVIPAVKIENVTVTPATAEIEVGKTLQFLAEVTGDNSNSVTWAVTGNSSNDTSISDEGILTVGADEIAGTDLTVTATSTKDTAISGIATVMVKTAQEDFVWLCDLPVAENDGDYVIHKNIDNNKALMDAQGKTYEHGIGMHSVRSITYNLEGKYETFSASFSPHFEVIANLNKSGREQWGIVSFQVYLDEVQVYDTGALDAHYPDLAVANCSINVSGAQTLKIVEDMAGIKTCDSAIVGDPKLYLSPEINSVTVTPENAEVKRGDTKAFTAVVDGDATNSVEWTVDGNYSKDTAISADGILTVGDDETSTSITVTATSTMKRSVSDTATVTVKAALGSSYIWLCDLPVSSSKYGYEIDADVDGNVLTDTLYNTYEHGIGMHSNNDGNEATDGPRYVEYNLDKKYSRFTAELSINKACVANLDASWAKDRTIANVLVKIWVDNTSYDYTVDAKTMRADGTATIGVDLDVSGAESLKIEVYQNAGDATCDATNIIEPKLYFAGDIEKIYVNDAGNGIEFNAETLTYDVTGAETTLTKVSLKDANGNELPVTVTINSNGKVAEFTVNGKTYTVYYTDTTSASYGPYMYLCDLIVSDSEGVYAVDANVDGDKKLIDANGKEYEHGLGMHSTRYITYDLNGGYNRFTATFSPHKEVEEPSTGRPTYGVVSFQVYLTDSEGNETKVCDTGALDIHNPSNAVVSCDITIPTGTKKLKIVESDGNGYATCDSAIVADPKLYFNAEGIQLLVNDKKVEDFSLTKYAYDVIADSADFKVVLADKNGIEYPVNVDYNGNTAAFRIGEKEYTVNCTLEDGYSLENIVIKIDVDRDGDAEASLESNAFTEVVEGKNYQYRYLLDEDETKIPKVTAYLFNSADSSKPLLEVKNVVQATQLPDCAIVTLRNKEYMIRFANNGDWTTISTELPDIFNEEKGIYEVEYEEGYFRDYTKTMMMKLFVCAGGKEAAYKFDEALELIKQIDNVTAGAPKIIYLVGWQSDGHDTGYPNWCEINPKLKCTNCDHEDALECLQWLMDEAWKYNTTVSFHLNASDIYSDNELGQLYVKNDLLHEVDGEPAPDKFWSTGVAYRANHWNDWHSGFFADRVDDFYEFLGKNSDGEYRLAKAGTVHSDAYQLHGSEQATLLQDAQGRAAQIRYWHSKGVDLTTEAIFNHHKKWNNDQASTVPGAFIKHDTWVDSSSNVNNIVESIVGIMPCAWKSMRGLSFYMRYPASVITTSYPNGSSAAKVNFLFGSSSRGEEFFTKNDTIAFPEGWDTSFATDFATSTAISFYMFQFDREELVNSNKVIHSEGLISDWGNRKVYFDGTDIVLRDNNDIFVPMVWEEDAVLAYAATDWTDREWTFTPDWTDETYTSVDLYVNTKDGRTFLKTVDVVNGKVALSAEAGQTLIIKPHLVEEKPPAGNGGGTGSSSSSSSKGESSKKEEATHVETVYAPDTSASTENKTETTITTTNKTQTASTPEKAESDLDLAKPAIPVEEVVVDTKIVEEVASEEVKAVVAEMVVVKEEKAIVTTESIEKVIEVTEEGATVIIPLKEAAKEGESVKEAEIPVESIEKIAEAEVALTVEFEGIKVTFEPETLKAIAEQSNDGVIELRIVRVEHHELHEDQQEELKDYDVQLCVTAQIFCEGKYVGDFKGGKARIAIPFTPEKGKAIEHHKVYYIADNGDMTQMPSVYVDGHMILETTHFSDFVIIYDEVAEVENTVIEVEEDVIEEEPVEEIVQEEVVLPIIPIVIIVIAVILVVAFFFKKKKKDEE